MRIYHYNTKYWHLERHSQASGTMRIEREIFELCGCIDLEAHHIVRRTRYSGYLLRRSRFHVLAPAFRRVSASQSPVQCG